MNDGIDDLDDLMQRANATPWGKTCSALWAQAAVMAEERGELDRAVRCYGELCAAYMMGGESTRVIAPFMWLDRMLKTRPDLFREEDITALGWYYKYVISTVRCVPTVSVTQCEALLDEMHDYYMRQGDSMRAYHIRSYLFHRDMGEMDKAEESYSLWLSAEHSELADCERCDPGYEVLYYSRQGRWEEAVAAGDKALAVEGEFCDAQPEALLTEMMEPWLRLGRDAEAWAAHIRAYRRYQQAPRYFEYLGDHFTYLALSGRAGRPERLERGLTILARHMPWWKEAEHPRVLMDTAAAVYVLLSSFPDEASQRVLPLTLPGEELPWAPRQTIENPTIAQAREWMRQLALDVAAQFDRRPGHRAPGAETRRVEKNLAPDPVPPLPVEEILKDTTGLGEYHSSITIAQPSHAEAAAAPRAASSKDAQDESQPPMLTLSATGDWQQMTARELLETSWRIAPHRETIYSLQLFHYLRSHPEENKVFQDSLPPELSRAGEWVAHSLSIDTTLEYVKWEDEGLASSTDPAITLLIQAEDLLNDGKVMEAAQLADRATRTHSADPHGVRIVGLSLLGSAAEKAGYLDEAIESYRDAVNLCALLGLKVDQALLSWSLAKVLGKKRRWIESAEVAQNALDLLELFPESWAHRVRLLDVASQANTQLKYYDAAGAYHHESAQILSSHGQMTRAVTSYSAAADVLSEAHDFIRAIDCRAAVVPLLEHTLGGLILEMELSDPSDKENYQSLHESLKETYNALIMALYSYARSIVMQPGNVPVSDIDLMEDVMTKLRNLVTDPEKDEWFPRSVEWREADWLSDLAFMHWQAYQYSTAMAEQRASIAAFEKLGDLVATAERVLSLGYMHRARGENSEATVCAQRVLALLKEPRFAGNPTKRSARELLSEISQDETDS